MTSENAPTPGGTGHNAFSHEEDAMHKDYQRAHTTIRRARGRASDRTCSCGARADEWALLGQPSDYAVPANNSRGLIYINDDPMAYEAMCQRHHQEYDRMSHPEQVYCHRLDELARDLFAHGMPIDLWLGLMQGAEWERDAAMEYEADVKAARSAR